MESIDWSPVLGAARELLLTAITAILLWAATWLRKEIARRAVDSALWAGAGLAFNALADKATQPSAIRSTVEAAVDKGAAYVAERVPARLRTLGVETDALPQMVASRLGQLRAQAGEGVR